MFLRSQEALFNTEFYVKLIEKIKDAGYIITPFIMEADTEEPKAILRHDIDVSPVKAVNMAIAEAENDVQSTYFFMVSSPLYNLLDRENGEALNTIRDLGHEIGLHFDCSRYEIKSEADLRRYVYREITILEDISSKLVTSVSWHIPASDMLGRDYSFLDEWKVKNAYSPKFFTEYRYLSDSNMHWREDPRSFVNPKKYPKLHILTHPIWYQFRKRKADILYNELDGMIDIYARYLEVISPGFMQDSPRYD